MGPRLLPGAFFMGTAIAVSIFVIFLSVSFYLAKGFLEKLMLEAQREDRERLLEMQRDFNKQVGELAQSFSRQSIELQAQHLAHLKELELKMISGGAKEYVDAQTMQGNHPNFKDSKDQVNADWVEFAPHPAIAPKQMKDLNFGVEDADGKVRVLGGKKKAKK